MQFFLASGTAWRLYFTKAEFTVYEQLDYSAKFQTCEGKARLQYENGHYDQTKKRFLGKRGGGDHLGSPKHNRRQRRARADNHSDNATRDPTPSSSPEREEAPQPPTR